MATQVTFREVDSPYAEKLGAMFGIKNGGMIEVNPGHVLMPNKFKEVADRIINLQVRPDDVWLVSYPRTGSTWTQEMIWCIGNDCDFERAKMIQHIRAPVLELTAIMGNDNAGMEKLLGETVSMVENMESPRFIKSHLPRELLPKQLEIVKPKIVYVCRNPKDMCVSFYHYCQLLHDMRGSFADFCDLFINDKVLVGPIWNHILGFWQLRNEPNVLFLRYEELKKDLRGGLERIAKFLNKTLTEKNMEDLLHHVSFASMKKNPAVNLEPVLEYRRNSLVTQMPDEDKILITPPAFIRKGEIGDFANHMTPEMIERFNDWTVKNLKGTGLSFDI